VHRRFNGNFEAVTISKPHGVHYRDGRQMTRYLMVGSVSFLLDVGGIWFAYRVLHLPIAEATALGFVAGLGFNFTASKIFTFSVRSDTQAQISRYAALLGGNFILTLIIVSVSEAWGPGYLLGKSCSVGLITVSNYFVLGRWVFVVPSPGQAIGLSGIAKDDMQGIGT
jgi:putative flippase GtrA